jgi:hypothetical protein
MGRGILTIFVVVGGILSILTGVMLTYVIPQDMTVADIKGLNIINTTNDERGDRLKSHCTTYIVTPSIRR